MKFTFTTPFAIFAVLFAGAAAAVPVLKKRDVFVPPVLYPTTGTVWTKGETHTVTWSLADAPVNITNKYGEILLRQGDLTTPVILANNFSILDGQVEIVVPWVEPGNYSIVLFGDSGNFSPEFTINGPSLL